MYKYEEIHKNIPNKQNFDFGHNLVVDLIFGFGPIDPFDFLLKQEVAAGNQLPARKGGMAMRFIFDECVPKMKNNENISALNSAPLVSCAQISAQKVNRNNTDFRNCILIHFTR